MSYFKAESIAPRKRLEKEAVALAMQGRWPEAADKNRAILDAFPSDVDAYNRLGRALMEIGNFTDAKDAYRKALELDPHNAIAKKNLSRLEVVGEGTSRPASGRVAPQVFVGETGKVGVVNLVHLAPRQVLAKMAPGDEVQLIVKGQLLVAETPHGEYLGEVEPAHGSRLAKLMNGGNKYIAAITSINPNGVKLIAKETYQHASQEGRPSFPPKEAEGFRAYVREGLLRTETGEEPEEEDVAYETSWEGEEEPEEETEKLPEGFSFVGGAATDEEE